MQQRFEIPEQLKLEVVRRLRHSSNEQFVAFLDILAINWREALNIFGNPNLKNITCQMPKNDHKPDVTEKYLCSDLNNSYNSTPPGPHTFCVDHDLDKCPIDGTDVKKNSA